MIIRTMMMPPIIGARTLNKKTNIAIIIITAIIATIIELALLPMIIELCKYKEMICHE